MAALCGWQARVPPFTGGETEAWGGMRLGQGDTVTPGSRVRGAGSQPCWFLTWSVVRTPHGLLEFRWVRETVLAPPVLGKLGPLNDSGLRVSRPSPPNEMKVKKKIGQKKWGETQRHEMPRGWVSHPHSLALTAALPLLTLLPAPGAPNSTHPSSSGGDLESLQTWPL